MGATITHVLGARPNFVKAAPVIRALGALGHEQRVVHTGQHYDERMSDVFFVQLGLPEPDANLGVGSGTQARQTAEVMVGMEQEFTVSPPARRGALGDVNSTIGAALTGVKLGVRLAHVEAGLRASMAPCPRRSTASSPTLSPTGCSPRSPARSANLEREGIDESRVFLVGNVMIDTLQANLDGPCRPSRTERFDLEPANSRWPPCTGRRTSTSPRESGLDLRASNTPRKTSRDCSRCTRATRQANGRVRPVAVDLRRRVRIVEPLGYFGVTIADRQSRLVLTDSGGVQEETTFLRVPCITLRPNTERPITITSGSNRLVTRDELAAAVLKACDDGPYTGELPPLWDGHAGPRIARVMTSWLRAAAPRGSR